MIIARRPLIHLFFMQSRYLYSTGAVSKDGRTKPEYKGSRSSSPWENPGMTGQFFTQCYSTKTLYLFCSPEKRKQLAFFLWRVEL